MIGLIDIIIDESPDKDARPELQHLFGQIEDGGIWEADLRSGAGGGVKD
jgi:hypothetical protein